jgi:hypothetical protein
VLVDPRCAPSARLDGLVGANPVAVRVVDSTAAPRSSNRDRAAAVAATTSIATSAAPSLGIIGDQAGGEQNDSGKRSEKRPPNMVAFKSVLISIEGDRMPKDSVQQRHVHAVTPSNLSLRAKSPSS